MKNPGDSKGILTYWKDKLISEIGKKTFKKLKENYKNNRKILNNS